MPAVHGACLSHGGRYGCSAVLASALTLLACANGQLEMGCRATSLRLSLWSSTIQASSRNAAAWLKADVPEGVCTVAVNNVNSVINCTEPICISGYRMAFLGPITADNLQWTIEGSLRTAGGMDSWLTFVEGGPTLASAATLELAASETSTYAIGRCPESQRCQWQLGSDETSWIADSEGAHFANWNLAIHLSAANFAFSDVSIADSVRALARVLEVDENQIRVDEAQVSMLGADSAQLSVHFAVSIFAEVPSSPTVVLTEDVQAAMQQAVHMAHQYVQAEAQRVISRCGAMGGDPQMFEQIFLDVAGREHFLQNTRLTSISITHPAQAALASSSAPAASVRRGTEIPTMQEDPNVNRATSDLTPVFEVVSGIKIEFFDSADFDQLSSQEGQALIRDVIAHFLEVPTSQIRLTGAWGAPAPAVLVVQSTPPPPEYSLFVDFVFKSHALAEVTAVERSLSPPTAGLTPPAVASAGPPVTNVAALYQRLVLSGQGRGMQLRFRQVMVVPGSTHVSVAVPGLAPPAAASPRGFWGLGSRATKLLLISLCVLLVAVSLACVSCCRRGRKPTMRSGHMESPRDLLSPMESPRELSLLSSRSSMSLPREFSYRDIFIAGDGDEEARSARGGQTVPTPVVADDSSSSAPRTRALQTSPLDAEATHFSAFGAFSGMAPPQLPVLAGTAVPGNPLMAAVAARLGAFAYAPVRHGRGEGM